MEGNGKECIERLYPSLLIPVASQPNQFFFHRFFPNVLTHGPYLPSQTGASLGRDNCKGNN